MKKLLLSITAVCAVGIINAQIYTATDSSDYAAWSTFDADADGNDWIASDLTGTGSSLAAIGGCFVSESYINGVGPLTPDNLAISPMINCSSNATVFLGWKAGSPESTAGTYFAEHYAVYVVNNPAILATGTFPTPVWEGTLTAGEVMQAQNINISALAGNQGTVYVVFRHFDCTDMFRLMLDQVTLSTTAGVEQNAIISSVYPNPTTGVLNIKTSTEATSVSIIAIDGTVVSETAINGLTGTVDVSKLVNGVYFYEITTADGSLVRNSFVKN